MKILGATCPITSLSLGLAPSTRKRWKTGGPDTHQGNMLTIFFYASDDKLQNKLPSIRPKFFTNKQICSLWNSYVGFCRLFVHYEHLEISFQRKESDGELEGR
jgi:hypothetical protein